MSMFHKATKSKAKLRLAICGPAGSGKTYTALALAKSLGSKVCLVDTERGSAAKYSDIFPFDTIELETFHPQLFIDAIHGAENEGYDVVVIDSLSHAWAGSGGVLEQADAIAKRMKVSNSFAAWKEATPLQKSLMDAILQCKIHIICTMRSKMEYVLEAVERNGRTYQQPKRVGMAPVQRDDVQYEFDVVGELDNDNNMVIVKTRCPNLSGEVIAKPGAKLAQTLRGWLTDGSTESARTSIDKHASQEGPETAPHERVLTGDIPPTMSDSTDGAVEDTPPRPAPFWSNAVAASLRTAREALSEKIGVPVDENVTREWLRKTYGLSSHKEASEEQIGALKSWMRASFKEGRLI